MSPEGNSSSLRLPRWIEALLGIAVLLQVITPLFAKTSGTDGPSQMYLMDQFYELLRQGVWLPRWNPGGFDGRGAASFYFYPPLAFYLAAAVRGVFGIVSSYSVFQLTCWLASLAGLGAAFVLLRSLRATRYWAVVGAALYTYAPFRIAELYSRSSLSSHVGFVFVPLIGLGVVWILTTRRLPGILMLTAAIACLLLTSVPVAVAVAIMASVVLIVCARQLSRTNVLDFGVAVLGGCALAAFYLLPALTLQRHIQVSNFLREPDFFLLDLLRLYGLAELYHTAIIFASAGLGIAAWLVVRRQDSSPIERTVARVALVIGCVIAFLQTPVLSVPVWHALPPLKLLQGSWRLYITVVLSAAVVVALIHTSRFRRLSNAFVALIAFGTFLPSVVVILNVHLSEHLEPAGDDPLEYLPKTALFGVAPQPTLQADSLRSVEPALSNERITLQEHGADLLQYEVRFTRPHSVTLPFYEWPLMRFFVADRALGPERDPSGYVRLQLPSGSYPLQLRVIRSEAENIGSLISLVSLLSGALALAIAGILKWTRSAPLFIAPNGGKA